MFQMPQRQQQTMLSSSPDKGTRDPSPVTALRQPLSPDNIAAIAVTDVASISSGYWDQHCQVMGDIYTRMASFFVADATLSDAVQSTPVSRTGSGGLSHLGRLGLLLGFFATASAAGLRGISGESSHSYSTSTRAIDGTNDWFRIAHIIEGNSSAARFNLNGHYGDNEWGMAIELHAGIMSLSSE